MMILVLIYHGLPMLGYSLACLFFWRLSMIARGHPPWYRGWAAFRWTAILLMLTRMINMADAVDHALAHRLLPVQTALVIVASSLFAWGAYWVWQAFQVQHSGPATHKESP